jgi:hypothetical protein
LAETIGNANTRECDYFLEAFRAACPEQSEGTHEIATGFALAMTSSDYHPFALKTLPAAGRYAVQGFGFAMATF